MNTPIIEWPGVSGKKYKYWIYPIDTSLKEEGGNYIFALESSPGHWSSVYIGQTNNLNERLENHEKENCARSNGATHIHAHLNSLKQNRLNEELDLIKKWKPVCNEQLI
ncbi:GIY-YIG nuclease family protein [candidate division KSB1 bacterium]|nr:GIY-YIG nuclease family protein [candidate division KSB1 bacterium]